MLDAEADRLCGAGRYERNEARQDTRAGSYDRTLQTSAGEVGILPPGDEEIAAGMSRRKRRAGITYRIFRTFRIDGFF